MRCHGKKILSACFFVLCLLMCTACGKKVENEAEELVLYHFGENDITYGEYYIYAKTVEEDYRQSYGNGVWELELKVNDENRTVRDITIEDIIEDINRVKVLAEHAADYSITLSDSEMAEIENRAEEFYGGLTDKDIKETEITKDIVNKVITDNMLAKKVYDQVLTDYDFEISDEEARMITFYDMAFECYSIEKDGSVKEYTDEKKALQLEKANEALSSLAQEEGTTYDDIVNRYGLEYSSEYTMSKSELIEEYGESVANKILELSNGEVSVVIETQYGYNIFKMIDSSNEELTKENKQQIVSSKQKEYFNGVYSDWVKAYDPHFSYPKSVDMELAGRFPFAEASDKDE